MRLILQRAALQRGRGAQNAARIRHIHASAAAGAMLGKIQRVLDQARPAPAPDKNQTAAKSQAASADAASVPGRAPEPAAASNGSSKPRRQRRQQQQQHEEHLRMPQEYWAADAMLGMPKVFGRFEQPADAAVAKIALIGAANAGKSTLVNRLTGAEVSIVSRRPQTTRTRIMASSTVGSRQLVFLDTPGVVSRAGLRRIARGVITAPWLTLAEADCAVLLLDAFKLTERQDVVEDGLFRHLARTKSVPAFLVFNKIDLVTDHDKLRAKAAEYRQRYRQIIGEPLFISALGNVGVDALKALLLEQARPGAWAVPAHATNDMSDLMRVEELIRAEWFERMASYLPYAIRQRNVCWEEASAPPAAPKDRPVLVIKQQLIVATSGQAKILIGSDGEHIKAISSNAARKIAEALGRLVRLHIQVVVDAGRKR
ncbi:hypothetical protein LPJ63_000354 [Coemansia sp. RSA 2711]|nr:hypothetical protein LPJ63_000354 [Coemansia sp. RSA 2711]KAJ2318680.1 hypothetical protein IWW52_002425 [Coemansia sp. RSA 2704]KAJ2320907.1 hypothetical protein IWW51_004535 [Coemansia sp. RSA 2702]